MKIMVINPNTTERMTRGIEASCRKTARPDTELIVTNPRGGVASIEGSSDGAIAAFHLLGLLQESETTQPADRIDGYVIACFDDTGLQAARELVRAPVIGIGEAALHVASLVAARFSVLTTLQRSVAILERNALSYGFAAQNIKIHASNINVLDLESDGSYRTLLERARAIVQQDHAEALVLGCGGMSHWSARLSDDLAVPVIDGVASAVALVEALASLGLGTSKAITYAYPTTKPITS